MMSVAHNRGGGTNVTAQPFPSSFSEHSDDDDFDLVFDGYDDDDDDDDDDIGEDDKWRLRWQEGQTKDISC